MWIMITGYQSAMIKPITINFRTFLVDLLELALAVKILLPQLSGIWWIN